MKYLLEIEFDAEMPELSPEPESLADLVRRAMNAEYGESGYRSTSVFVGPADAGVRALARTRWGIVS